MKTRTFFLYGPLWLFCNLTVNITRGQDMSINRETGQQLFMATILGTMVSDDFRVLIYHETNGFRHNSIDAGIAMIEGFGFENEWIVEESQSSAIFNDANLAMANVVVWLNTSGNGLLTTDEKSAFEQFIQNGGGFVGVHAATDTYRDGSWPWYNDLVGAIVQSGPNHTSNNFNATMDVLGTHPAVTHLGMEWNKNEEYYYWELNGGYLYDGNIDLLSVRSTGSQSYDAPRPITWYKIFDGGRSFYTALGHNASDYIGDENFRTMIEQAILWAGGEIDIEIELNSAQMPANSQSVFEMVVAYPNPVDDLLTIRSDGAGFMHGRLISLTGTVLREVQDYRNLFMDLSDLESGMYLLHINQNGNEKWIKIVKR